MIFNARALLGVWLLAVSCALQAQGGAVLLRIDGAISPATSDYFVRGLASAADRDAGLVILQINTPGGLDSSMRTIVQAILGSDIPVASWVAPNGARAASAGTYILYASHVAAMAPGTNLGAATPVQLGGGGGLPDVSPSGDDKGAEQGDKKDRGSAMEHKMVNDATAYLRALAKLRGRNAEWAEKAVREAASLPADEALELDVIDLVAGNRQQLLQAMDGMTVEVRDREQVLATADMDVEVIEPDWRTRLLSVIADPNITYILILIGIYGLIFEFYNPGFVFPGVVGALCLLLALFALQVLPVNYAGLGLLIMGIVFMVSEAFVPSFGALGIGGLIAFVIGSILLIDADQPGYGVSLPLIFAFSAVSGAFFLGVIGMAVKARRRPVVSGQEELIGKTGVVLEDFSGEGRIRVHSESWAARAQGPLKRGQTVRVTRLEGLTLYVEPLKEE